MSFGSNTPAGPAGLLARLRKAMLWAGGIMAALGLAALLMPVVTSLVVGLLIGWFLFLGGVVTVAGAFSFRGTGLFGWQLLGGLLPLVAGALLILFPEQGVIALTLLVAVVFLATGAAQLSFALWARPVAGWGWGVVSAAVSIVLGSYILLLLPEASEVVLGLLVGIDFLSTGAAMLLIAWPVGPGPARLTGKGAGIDRCQAAGRAPA